MIAWDHNKRTFCAHLKRQRRQQAAMLADLYAQAANDHSRALVDKLAARWQLERYGYWRRPATPQDLADLAAWRQRLAAAST